MTHHPAALLVALAVLVAAWRETWPLALWLVPFPAYAGLKLIRGRKG